MSSIKNKLNCTENQPITWAYVYSLAESRYKCPYCEDKIITASKDPSPIEKSIASPSLLAYVAISKFEDSLPLYRQEQIFKRFNVEVNRSSMSRWMICLSQLAMPLLNLMHEDLLESPIAHCDETRIQVLKEKNKRAESQSYMWCLAKRGPQPILLYRYYDNRSAMSAWDLLDGFSGYLQVDGYKVYDKIANKLHLNLAACWAHVRRKFWEAEKFSKQVDKKAKPLASEALEYIKKLYAIEKTAKGENPLKIQRIRNIESKKYIEEFHTWLLKHQNLIPPKSKTGKAIQYTLNQWDKLSTYLEHPDIEMDNNFIERCIKVFVIGRKNWLFADTPAGAHASAALYSLIQTAKANDLNPFEYLHHIFTELPKAKSLEDYQRLLPYRTCLPE